MKRQLVAPTDPVLIKQAEAVDIQRIAESDAQGLIEDMLDVAYGNRTDRSKPTMVGLAAPQVGISKQIILVDVGADGTGGLSNLRVYLNPQIVSASTDTEEWCEGCWSTERVCGVVGRSKKITISAYSASGRSVTETHEGYVARIFQHEVDHLRGREFVNHIKDPDKLHWVEKAQWLDYKQNGGWRDWPHKCTFEKWRTIKGT
jgi:peptide deformylase